MEVKPLNMMQIQVASVTTDFKHSYSSAPQSLTWRHEGNISDIVMGMRWLNFEFSHVVEVDSSFSSGI